jgi:hypothetical protein
MSSFHTRRGGILPESNHLDYFIMRLQDLKRVRDAGIWKRGVDSDHKAIFLKLEIAQKFIGPREPRLHCIDRRVLENPGVRCLTKRSFK